MEFEIKKSERPFSFETCIYKSAFAAFKPGLYTKKERKKFFDHHCLILQIDMTETSIDAIHERIMAVRNDLVRYDCPSPMRAKKFLYVKKDNEFKIYDNLICLDFSSGLHKFALADLYNLEELPELRLHYQDNICNGKALHEVLYVATKRFGELRLGGARSFGKLFSDILSNPFEEFVQNNKMRVLDTFIKEGSDAFDFTLFSEQALRALAKLANDVYRYKMIMITYYYHKKEAGIEIPYFILNAVKAIEGVRFEF